MNFFSWQYRQNNKVAYACDAEQSIAEHDKRFHPDGYKEGDVCKLRDDAKRQDLLPSHLETYKGTISLLKNFLPSVKIVEEESSEALENSLTDDVRRCIKHSDWTEWKKFLSLFSEGRLNRVSPDNKKQFYPVLSYIPPVIRSCFEAIGYPKKPFYSTDARIVTDVRTISKSIDMSEEVQNGKVGGESTLNEPGRLNGEEETAFQKSIRATGMKYAPPKPGAYLSLYDYVPKQTEHGFRTPHFHGVSFDDVWGNIPLIIDKPIAVFRSATEPRGILLLCKYEDSDPQKVWNDRTANRDKENGNTDSQRHQYSVVAMNGPMLDGVNGKHNGEIRISSAYGRSRAEFSDDLSKGLLLYVDKSQLKDVEDQFGQLKLGEYRNQNPTKSFIKYISGKNGFHSLIEPKQHGVMTEDRFAGDMLGMTYDESFLLRRDGMFKEMHKIMDEYAASRGYKYDDKTGFYVDENNNCISAELQEWDGNGNPVPLEERFSNPKDSDRRYKIIRTGEEPVGWYNRTTGEVHLVKGRADAETVAHELGWHASFHYAEQKNPALHKKMLEYAKNAPEGIKEAVREIYGTDLNEYELLDEIGARRFTEEHISNIVEEVKKKNAKSWFGKVLSGVGEIYRGFLTKIGGDRIHLGDINKMSPSECIKKLAVEMASGKTLSTKSPG